MRAFVTGGTGLVGSHLVEGLIAHGWQVAVLTRSAERARALFDDRAWVVEGDLTRPNFHAELARTDVVFHAAGWIELGVRDGRRMLDVNVTGAANLLSIARKEGVPRIVYTDTAGGFTPGPGGRPPPGGARAGPPTAGP